VARASLPPLPNTFALGEAIATNGFPPREGWTSLTRRNVVRPAGHIAVFAKVIALPVVLCPVGVSVVVVERR
jgi:hypothetical protein